MNICGKSPALRVAANLWSTPFRSSGFDLNALGVINQAAANSSETYPNQISRPLYFNTISNTIHVVTNTIAHPQNNDLNLFNLAGQLCFKTLLVDVKSTSYDIPIPSNLNPGTYIAKYKNYSIKIILTDNR